MGTTQRRIRPGRVTGLRLARVAALLAVVAALLAGGCSGEKPPNLLLISVDTLRPDRLGFAGSPRPTSPAIDRLAREGVVFPNAYSSSGWTLPSMASILSGRYPKEHGAVTLESALRDDVPTLATILQRHGFETRGYVSHVVLVPKYGFDRGFDRFDASVLDIGHPHRASTDRQLSEKVIAEMGDLRQPFFLWVHYFGPHFDYLFHAGWESFGTSETDRYDQEVAFTDAHVGKLLEELGRRGLLEHTVVVFTSDHGEEFGEHGSSYHYTLHGEVIRVPLILRAPGLEPGTRPTPVEQVDLLPTILGLLGIAPEPGEAGSGRDVLASSAPHAPIFLERVRPAPFRQRAVIDGGLKLVVIDELPPKEGEEIDPKVKVQPGTYLYDTEADPGETKNLYTAEDPRARELLAKLEAHFADAEAGGAPSVEVEPELREQLRDLGYVE